MGFVAPIVEGNGLGIGGIGRPSPPAFLFPAFVGAIPGALGCSASGDEGLSVAFVALVAAVRSLSLPLRFAPRWRLKVEMETASPSAASICCMSL
ncbi:hypothetical protein [Methylocystis parvus]|uniref:Uncharacterized protein n=1 Tax=Methylocystis parvus TaxID=134 RepID=A0A6B8M479_9HYPH|nr:hypothetical protein [Methylocystis parvus]QGM99807.1 hypothetical protein F7D14_19545 [Methylocystis parvus]WBK02226.1 hypothetical protein MMG94_20515 [Methylocystis parvus OBBP]